MDQLRMFCRMIMRLNLTIFYKLQSFTSETMQQVVIMLLTFAMMTNGFCLMTHKLLKFVKQKCNHIYIILSNS